MIRKIVNENERRRQIRYADDERRRCLDFDPDALLPLFDDAVVNTMDIMFSCGAPTSSQHDMYDVLRKLLLEVTDALHSTQRFTLPARSWKEHQNISSSSNVRSITISSCRRGCEFVHCVGGDERTKHSCGFLVHHQILNIARERENSRSHSCWVLIDAALRAVLN